jgi:hypothetical protein
MGALPECRGYILPKYSIEGTAKHLNSTSATLCIEFLNLRERKRNQVERVSLTKVSLQRKKKP